MSVEEFVSILENQKHECYYCRVVKYMNQTHVFIRRDAVKSPLQPPYDGPFKVISRATKFFKIDLGTRTDTVSLDRLKPAHLDTAAKLSTATPRDEPAPDPTDSPEPQARRTRSGRHVHFPTRYVSIVYR